MVGNRQLKTQIHEVLVQLGGCRTEVAEALSNSGVRAVPQDPQNCALAVYLKAVLGGDQRVSSVLVRRRDVEVLVDERKLYRVAHRVRISLPQPIRDFIVAFDVSAYPALLRETTTQDVPSDRVTP
jgi:hypothetical protein